jgi:chemotaxis protein MotA
MSLIIGLLVVFGSVFGGFVLGHGHLLSLWQPTEILVIGGAAVGAFIVAQPFKMIKECLLGFLKLFGVNPYTKKFYLDLLTLFFNLGTKIRSTGLLSVEEDIENPKDSPLFNRYPKILNNKRLMTFIRDNIRIVISGNLSNYELESLLDSEIELLQEEMEKPSAAIGNMSDGFPGFGIVAAVLGIVHTMQAIGGDAGELGKKVAGALVGTFLGVLLAYGVVGPIGTSIGNNAHKEIKIYHCVKILILAFMAGTAPKMAVEYARKSLYSDVRPDFSELEEYLKSPNNTAK